MNFTEKIKNSWWVILSFIFFLNGLGFLYIGFKHNNRNWILEGITYEIPWVFYFILSANYGFVTPTKLVMSFALIMMLIGVIRSIWVAVKLIDVYQNNEKYTIKQTNFNHQSPPQRNNDNSSGLGCCLCLVCVFIVFMIIIF